MIILPSLLKRFQKEAKEALSAGLAKDIEFSGPTYQVLVNDPRTKKEEWAFIQLDPQGRLKDSFCSCEQSENGRGCIHQAIGFLHIYGKYSHSLHVRFEHSLWNQLCKQSCFEMSNIPDQLKATKEGKYICRDSSGKIIFSIQGKTSEAIAHLEKMLFQRLEETEETSLKFSNLTENELALWEQGKPPPQLAYELSFWSDIAKWLMLLQEAHKAYYITIGYSSKKLPNNLSAVFPDLFVEWTLFEEYFSMIIPSLITVDSPLMVRTESTEGIEEIVYDKQQKCFDVIEKKDKKDFHASLKEHKGIVFGDWIYVPEEGFYSNQHCFSKNSKDLKNVEKLLNEHAATVKNFISGCVIREVPVPVSYALSFDNDWNLHLRSYLFTPGDLSKPYSQAFGTWVYVDNRGFYKWEGRYFDEIETVIAAKDVQDFISQHRSWLNTQEGFHTHLNPLSSDLNFYVSEDNYLAFSRNLTYQDTDIISKDFGHWVYISGQGFFSKASTHAQIPVRAGMTVPSDQVPFFIRNNMDDLKVIRDFFSLHSPVANSRVRIELLSQERVCITPEYDLLPEYQKKRVCFFDDFSYVEGEGFHEMVGDARLPEKFRQPTFVEAENLTHFILHELEGLIPFASYVDPRLLRPKQISIVANQIRKEEHEGKLSYALQLDYCTDLGQISLVSLWKVLHKNQRFAFTEDGLFDLTDKRFGWLRQINKKKIDKKTNTLLLTPLEVLRLNAFEEITVHSGKDAVHKDTKSLLKDLKEFHVHEEPDLKGLKSHLRPYQELGLKWLWFLYHQGLSGLLCDDMGLGKTHQAMGLLTAVGNYWKKQGDSTKRHFVVICPTSVIYHWQEKLKDFLPNLKIWTFHGTNRSLENFESDYDILLTSYGIWRNETSQLSKIAFEVAIFDELQIAKNQTSRIYNALLKVNARLRLGMTGTPIENRLRELKALFDIVLPSYMPSENDYREYFIRPIEKEGDLEKRMLLARLIKPFVLRRKKEDVLLDLPEKTEQISHCDLLPDQRKLYIEVLSASRDKLIDELKNSESPIPYMHIFSLLSHLKQICNHPAAYLKKPAEYKQYESGKWELFLELLEESRESQQKIVVFSHYLSMLDIIEDYLNEHGIGFASIRGATLNRGEQLKRFNNDPNCEVFVASLQAAGLGIDLTAGSVVVHYDRWWNAARENQATDRVHRIGQTRGVQVFKLMTKGTIEEHIDFLISKKGRLMEEVVSADDHQMIKKFDRQEMIALLQSLPSS
jgi:superfamily II DNA or RNA helicase